MSSVSNPFRSANRGLLAFVVGLALVAPQSASAGAGADSIWQECGQTGTVSTNHSNKDFQDALSNPPADAAEYSPCLDQIRAAQNKAASGVGTSGGGGGAAGGGTGGGSATGGAAAPVVAPQALSEALAEQGVNPAAPVGTPQSAPAPTVIAGETIDLEADRLPSIANALSLPLPLAASAIVVMFSAALPVIRFAVGRFGAPPTGTTPNL